MTAMDLFVLLSLQRYEYFMSEKTISIESVHPLDIFGANDQNLEMIRERFPKLKIVARDNFIKAFGDEQQLLDFEEKFSTLLLHFEKFGRLTKQDISTLLSPDSSAGLVTANGQLVPESHSEVLVHGKNGMLIRARTANQRRMVESCRRNDLVFAIGPAGTGKTYTAVALAVRALKNKEVQRIILTRPAVEAGENLGFLPGDLKEKLDPYLQPLYDALKDMLPGQKLLTLIEEGVIEIAPLAFMRGRTLNNAFAILDEAQNTTPGQLKMFLTRMGASSKFIVTGDITQIDLPKNQQSGLVHSQTILNNIPGIEFIYLDNSDIIRHKLVSRIITAYAEKA
jgi:phosphate starvation-inducible PhoH-like protein